MEAAGQTSSNIALKRTGARAARSGRGRRALGGTVAEVTLVPKRDLDPTRLGDDEDWEGNNAAFRCPSCGKVFLVSGSRVHRGERRCPKCGKSVGRISTKGGRQSGGTASIEW